jgi:hypothetical protein
MVAPTHMVMTTIDLANAENNEGKKMKVLHSNWTRSLKQYLKA